METSRYFDKTSCEPNNTRQRHGQACRERGMARVSDSRRLLYDRLLYMHAKNAAVNRHIHTHKRTNLPMYMQMCVCACSCLGHTDKLKRYKKANEAKTRFTNQANSFYDVRCRSCCFSSFPLRMWGIYTKIK